jgi:membrane-associated phospholipid phosphatase
MKHFRYISFTLVLFILVSAVGGCNTAGTKPPKKEMLVMDTATLLHTVGEKITDVIILDVFNPPVSSRIYAYTSLAGYEALRLADKNAMSIAQSLHGFETLPFADDNKSHDYPLAAVEAMLSVAEKLTFSADTFTSFRQQIIAQYSAAGVSKQVIQNSTVFGKSVAAVILQRAEKDQYKETRAMEKYLLKKSENKWQPTPPEYNDAAEPNWRHILPLALDSAHQYRKKPSVSYSNNQASAYYQEVMEVYKLGDGHDTSLHSIAWFWDDNPFVTGYSGHLTNSKKKMTPAGHWMAIAGLAAKQNKLSAIATARVQAATALSLFDAFISCWDGKYYYETVRPITLIHKWIDPNWKPLLQTPPFPEYPSGHSVISAAAAEVLTAIIGDQFSYTDTTELTYGRGQRSFTSFRQAAEEASVSRLYGGIHFRYTLQESSKLGKQIGQLVVKKIVNH